MSREKSVLQNDIVDDNVVDLETYLAVSAVSSRIAFAARRLLSDYPPCTIERWSTIFNEKQLY